MEIRALRQTDDRTQFRSGDPDLDRFFQRFAAQNQYRHYIGATYVAEDAGRILAFTTVAPGHMEIEALPAAARRGLARYPLTSHSTLTTARKLPVTVPAQGRRRFSTTSSRTAMASRSPSSSTT